MTTDTLPGAVPAAELDDLPTTTVDGGLPEAPAGRDVSLREVAAWVYAFFYNKRVGLLLILALGVMSLFGALFQQVPDSVREDPTSYAAWLRDVQPKYGGWTQVLSTLGMFHVFSSLWFRITTVLLALSIIGCTTHRLPRLWKAATQPHVHVREAFFEHARLRAEVPMAAKPVTALERAADALRSQGYRVLPDGHGTGWYADRFRWMPFGTAIAHAAFVVILAGMLVSSLAGFSEDNLSVTVGSKAEVGHGTGLTVEAVAFNAEYYEGGRPKDYYSELVLYRGGAEVARQTVRVNEPLRYEGVAFHQAFFGTAAVLTLTDSSGATLFSGGVPLQWTTTDGQNVYGRVVLEKKGIEVYVIGVASGAKSAEIGPGQVAIEVYALGQNQPMGSKVLSQGTPATLGDVTATFNRERAYTGLMVVKDPGAILVWLGSFLIIVGMGMTMFFRHRRIWVAVRPEGRGSVLRLASPDRFDLGFQTRFRALAATLGQAATTPTTKQKGSDHA